MQKTTNYQLNQWDKTDRIMMEDFNADNAKIDAALHETVQQMAEMAVNGLKIATGTYTGDGTYGESNANSITLPFVPKLVLIQHPTILYDGERGERGKLVVCAALSSSYKQYTTGYSDNVYFKLNDTTLSWYSTSSAAIQCNSNTYVYTYFAIG